MKYSGKILILIPVMLILISCAIPQEIALYLFTPTPSLVPTITNTFPPSLTPFQPQTHTFTPEPSLTATQTHTPTQTLTSTPTSTGTLTPSPSNTFTPPPSLTVPVVIVPTWTTSPYRSATPTRTRTRTSTKSSSSPTPTPVVTATITSTGETTTPVASITSSATANPNPSNTPRPDCSAMTPNADYTTLIFNLVNQARVDNGLPKLKWDSRLAAAAARHSLDMACNSFVSHTGSDGTRAPDRVQDEGYSFQWVGENIYGGWGSYGDPNNVFTWWMNSEAHRNNILGIYYQDTGVGYYLNPETGRGYFTIVFGVPR